MAENQSEEQAKGTPDSSAAEKTAMEFFKSCGITGYDTFTMAHKYRNISKEILKEIIELKEENSRLKTMYVELRIQYHRLNEQLKEDF